MLRYDKDMERVMLEKKIEVIKELEEHKTRILKELSGVDKTTLTRLREVLADYNNINYQITTRINEIEEKVENNSSNVPDNVEERISSLEFDLRNTQSGLANYNDRINQNAFAIEMTNMNLQNLSGVPSALETITSDIASLNGRVETVEINNINLSVVEMEIDVVTDGSHFYYEKLIHRYTKEENHTEIDLKVYSYTYSRTGLLAGTGIDLKKVLNLMSVTPTFTSGGAGFTKTEISFMNDGSSMSINIKAINQGNGGDIPTKLKFKFLVADKEII